MINQMNFLATLVPEYIIIFFLMVIVFMDMSKDEVAAKIPLVAMSGLLLALLTNVFMAPGLYGTEKITDPATIFVNDGFAFIFKFMILASSLIMVYFFRHDGEINAYKSRRGEFYTLFYSMVLGMLLLASANDLIAVYVALEVLSLPSYIAAGFLKTDKRSSEASLKYLLFGSVASGVMLFGISLLYLGVGSTSFKAIVGLGNVMPFDVLTILSIIFIIGGFGYKISMVPFHFWAPDVFEGSPVSVTTFLSVSSKIAGVAVFVRFVVGSMSPEMKNTEVLGFGFNIVTLLVFLSIMTMTVGNLTAIFQNNMKRLLAYSSIGHIGFIVAAMAANSENGLIAISSYLLVYTLMNFGAFLVILLIKARIGSEDIRDYKGLGYKLPFLSVMMVIFMVSLAGLPPTAGFWAKFYVFTALMESKLYLVAFAAIFNTVIAVFYYFRILKTLYFEKSDNAEVLPVLSGGNKTVLLILGLPLLILGIYFSPVVEFARETLKIAGF
ncbi:MAG: NADH-quinone oxidoreductase subunit N [Chlorobiota bacterium]|nr:MAG: NADH-quinone oxidoreductase subunit N [Chlorobiota bacterium]